ncbi:MAG TPA: Zn-binding domain-containing protein, partial [Candidatus Acidoferrum sp.]|nr:Zn-binding domain-containing protein [Candidatus Acidoferrum sp.]
PVEVDYYTQTSGEKETEILHCQEFRQVGETVARLGRVKVTERITGYEKRRIFGQDRIGSYPLDLPPHTFETQGLWLEIPEALREHVKSFGGGGLHFMGGIHAMEHAMIGLFPLFALCDRGDVGGISYTFHPQVGRSAIFVYDGYPEGIGLAERCYRVLGELLTHTLRLLQECPCEIGCPSCIHSPKCGSGNKPLDKAAAILTLQGILGRIQIPEVAIQAQPPAALSAAAPNPRALPRAASPPAAPPILVLDVETQRSAEEVGGWDRSDRMGLAVAVTADLATGEARVYLEDQVNALLDELSTAACIIGFNVRRFDYAVLSAYRALNFRALPTLDILEEIHTSLGFRLSLNHLAQETLAVPKLADGLQSLAWFRAGELDKVIEYCKSDVDLTRRLFEFGRTQGYLLYKDYQGRSSRLPVRFGEIILLHGGRFIYNAPPLG